MPARSRQDDGYEMSPIDHDLVRAHVYMRAEESIKAARSRGLDQTHIELWRALCPGGIGQPSFELARLTRAAHLTAARRYAQSAGRFGIAVEIDQRDDGRAYWIDLDLRW